MRKILGEVFFFQNYLGGVWNHTWSLAVEEHFYIGLALLVACLVAVAPTKPFHRMPLIFALIASSCFALRVLNLVISPKYSHRTYLYGTHLRVDSLMFGVLLSYLWSFRGFENRIARIPSSALLATGAALLAPAFIYQLETNRWISIVGVMMFYLGSGFVLVAAMRLKTSACFAIRGLAALGAASYSIYLWHMPVSTWGHDFVVQVVGFDNNYLYLFNAIVGACAFGWLLNRLIENPILQLRDRLFPSHSNAVSPDKASKEGGSAVRTSTVDVQ